MRCRSWYNLATQFHKSCKLIEILFSFHSNVENVQVKLVQICKNSAFVFSNLKMIDLNCELKKSIENE